MKNNNLKIILNNEIINIENINSTHTVNFIKKNIYKLKGIDIKKQKLFLNNVELKDNLKIRELNIDFLDIILCTIF